VTRTLQSAHFPDLSACPDAELAQRWTAMLGRAPRLRPWLERMVRQRRVVLQQSGHGSVEEAIWLDLSRWLQEFEALPHFAVTAIAVTLEEPGHDGWREGTGRKERAERDGWREGTGRKERAEGEPRQPLPAQTESPERAATELESLLCDPAFALAFHCVDARLRPALPGGPIPEPAWFGMLHASAPPQPLLTPEVAVGLVLRVSSADWARLPSGERKAALRLFHAAPADLRAAEIVQGLCARVPAAWGLSLASAAEFVSAAARARAALTDACGLCARLAAAARPSRSGGLSVLHLAGAPAASADDLAGLAQTARKFAQMAGFRRLLALL
jgi:hypothetical protein